MREYDYIAIGGGSGGIASINRAASYGQKCAIIEAKYLGGTCVNVGCVPKKVMWYGAQIAEAINLYAPDYGFDVTVNQLQNYVKAVKPILIVFINPMSEFSAITKLMSFAVLRNLLTHTLLKSTAN